MNEYLEDRIYNYSWSENHGFTREVWGLFGD